MWTGPIKQNDNERRRVKIWNRRASHKSDTNKRRHKVIGNLYEFGIESRGIDENAGLCDEDKKDVIAAVISATMKTEK